MTSSSKKQQPASSVFQVLDEWTPMQSSANINNIISVTWKDDENSLHAADMPWNVLLVAMVTEAATIYYKDINPTPNSKDTLQNISWEFSEMAIAIPQSSCTLPFFAGLESLWSLTTHAIQFFWCGAFSYITRQNPFAKNKSGTKPKAPKKCHNCLTNAKNVLLLLQHINIYICPRNDCFGMSDSFYTCRGSKQTHPEWTENIDCTLIQFWNKDEHSDATRVIWVHYSPI